MHHGPSARPRGIRAEACRAVHLTSAGTSFKVGSAPTHRGSAQSQKVIAMQCSIRPERDATQRKVPRSKAMLG